MGWFWKIIYLVDGSMHLQINFRPCWVKISFFDYATYKKTFPKNYERAGWVKK